MSTGHVPASLCSRRKVAEVKCTSSILRVTLRTPGRCRTLPVIPVTSLKEELYSTTERPLRTQNALLASDLGRVVPRLRSTGTAGFSGRSDNPVITTTVYGFATATYS